MTLPYRLAPALFVILWATGFIGARYAMPHAQPFGFLAVRFAIVFALVGAFLAARRTPLAGWRDAAHAAIAGTLMHGVYLGAVFWAIRNGLPAGFSALVVGLQPLITALMARPVLGESIGPRHWLGLAAGFAGVVLVLEPKLGVAGGGVNAATLGAAFVSVLGMSAGTIWQKRFVADIGLVEATLWQYAGAALLMALMALLTETGEFELSAQLVLAMAWLVFVLSIGAIALLMQLIRRGAVSKVASLFYLVPGTTALMAWALFGETLSPLQIAGMALAGGGVALATAQRPMRARASR